MPLGSWRWTFSDLSPVWTLNSLPPSTFKWCCRKQFLIVSYAIILAKMWGEIENLGGEAVMLLFGQMAKVRSPRWFAWSFIFTFKSISMVALLLYLFTSIKRSKSSQRSKWHNQGHTDKVKVKRWFNIIIYQSQDQNRQDQRLQWLNLISTSINEPGM